MTASSARPASPWPQVALLYGCGLLAAAQLGKLSALAPLVAAALGLGLPVVALAISLIEVGGATLGAVAGLLAQRLGLVPCLRWGVAALAVAGLGGASAQGVVGLFGWRLLEAAGYLAVIVSAPVLIVQCTHAAGHRTQGLAMTLWSTFVPVGLALGASGSALAAVPLGWRGAVAAGGVLALLLWATLWRGLRWHEVPPGAPTPVLRRPAEQANALPAQEAPAAPAAPGSAGATPSARPGAALWCLSLGFGGYALFAVGLLALLPTLLVAEAGLSPAAAGQWTALVAVSAVVGSAGAAWLLRLGSGLRWPMLLALGVPPLLLFGVFTPAPVPAVAIALALLVNMAGGVYASGVFALLPRLAPAPATLVRANGLLAQCGASGSLLGPPLMAACVQAGGWVAAAVLGLLVSLLALPLTWRAVAPAQR